MHYFLYMDEHTWNTVLHVLTWTSLLLLVVYGVTSLDFIQKHVCSDFHPQGAFDLGAIFCPFCIREYIAIHDTISGRQKISKLLIFLALALGTQANVSAIFYDTLDSISMKAGLVLNLSSIFAAYGYRFQPRPFVRTFVYYVVATMLFLTFPAFYLGNFYTIVEMGIIGIVVILAGKFLHYLDLILRVPIPPIRIINAINNLQRMRESDPDLEEMEPIGLDEDEQNLM